MDCSTRYCTLKTLAALQRLRLIIQTSLLGSYMRKSACSVLRVSIGLQYGGRGAYGLLFRNCAGGLPLFRSISMFADLWA